MSCSSEMAAWLALGLSAFVGINQLRIQRQGARRRESEHARLEAARQRAEISMTLEADRVYVRNYGLAPALNVSIRYVGPGDAPTLRGDRGLEPKERLTPGESYSFLVAISRAYAPPFWFEVSWRDPGGEERVERLEVRR